MKNKKIKHIFCLECTDILQIMFFSFHICQALYIFLSTQVVFMEWHKHQELLWLRSSGCLLYKENISKYNALVFILNIQSCVWEIKNKILSFTWLGDSSEKILTLFTKLNKHWFGKVNIQFPKWTVFTPLINQELETFHFAKGCLVFAQPS